MIKIYSIDNCPYCQELKGLLIKEGIEFEEVNVYLPENEKEFETITKVSNSNEVPIIKIGQQLFIPNISFQTIPEGILLIKKFLT